MREFLTLFFKKRQILFIIFDRIIAKKQGFCPKNLETLTNKALVSNCKSGHKKSIFQIQISNGALSRGLNHLEKVFEKVPLSFFSKQVYITFHTFLNFMT